MKWLDTPPAWLAGALIAAWLLSPLAPWLSFGGWAHWAGMVILLAGLAVVGVAALAFRRAGTTIVPNREPSAIITGGIFSLSRNPIYLGDALVLTGLILRWDAVLAVPLIAVFVWIIRRRFIDPEEAGLKRSFHDEFASYAAATRRWL